MSLEAGTRRGFEPALFPDTSSGSGSPRTKKRL